MLRQDSDTTSNLSSSSSYGLRDYNFKELKKQLSETEQAKRALQIESILTLEALHDSAGTVQQLRNQLADITFETAQINAEVMKSEAIVKAIQRSEALELMLERKRFFVRQLSHEIRTPMNIAISGLELMRNLLHDQPATNELIGNLCCMFIY